jgi:broad specificity phosphatase PhoE
MYNIILVRHGTTQAMDKHVMQGSSDSPRLASNALERIHFNAVFSSPAVRTSETAAIIAKPHPGLTIFPLDTLREMDFGYYEGRPYFASPDEVAYGFKRFILILKVLFAQATGESSRSLSMRAKAGWEKISTIIPAGEILIVSHAVLLNYLLKYLLPKAAFNSIQSVNLRPCSITELEITMPGDARIVRLNDTSHLK